MFLLTLVFFATWIQEARVPRTIKLDLKSQHFTIERADLLVQPKISSTHSGERPGVPVTRQSLEDFVSKLQTLVVTDGSVSVLIDHPGPIEGKLLEISARRPSGERVFFPLAEFSCEVTEENWRAGAIVVNLDSYREVLIKVRDRGGRAVPGPLSLLSEKQGGAEFSANETGEVRLLLASGTYVIQKPAGPIVRFEVTATEGEPTPEIMVLTEP